jgi:hypothetical protein
MDVVYAKGRAYLPISETARAWIHKTAEHSMVSMARSITTITISVREIASASLITDARLTKPTLAYPTGHLTRQPQVEATTQPWNPIAAACRATHQQ